MQKIFYDADCGLCEKSIYFLKKLGYTQKIYSLQSKYAQKNLPTALQNFDTIIFFNRGYYIKSTAIIKIIGSINPLYKICYIAFIIPRCIRDSCYDFIAKRRKRICSVLHLRKK